MSRNPVLLSNLGPLAAAALLGVCGCASRPEAREQQKETPPPSSAEVVATSPTLPAKPMRSMDEVRKAFEARAPGLKRLNATRQSTNAGRIVVTFTVDPGGQVVECRILSTDFDDRAFNAAVVAEVWRLWLEKRDVGEFVVAEYPIEFTARVDEPKPAAQPEAVPMQGTQGSVHKTFSGPRTLEEIRDAFDSRKAALFDFYSRYLRDQHPHDPVQGTIQFSFRVTPGGELVDCRIVSSDFKDAGFNEGVLAQVRMVRLARREVATFDVAQYPISFLPQ
jgi:hypothetical protein